MLAWDEVETLNQEASPGGVVFGARGSKGGELKPLYHRWVEAVVNVGKAFNISQGNAFDR